MSLVILRLMIFISLLANLTCSANNSLNYEDNIRNVYPTSKRNYPSNGNKIIETPLPPMPNNDLLKPFTNYGRPLPQHGDEPEHHINNYIIQKSKENDFQKERKRILKAASNIIQSKSIAEMVKQLKAFYPKFVKGLSNEKSDDPFIRKLKSGYNDIMAEGKSVLEMAKKLEKSGAKKTNKQLAAFKTKIESFTKRVDKLIESVKTEAKKQRNRNLKIVKNNPKDISVLTKAKRCINLVDLVSDTIRLLQSIPGKINCLIFGNCEASNDDNNGGDTDTDNEGEDDDDEEEGEEGDDEKGDDR